MFKLRSYQKELLDEPSIQKNLLFQNLKELEIINKYLGGHRISLAGLEKLITDKTKTYKIMDVGCGGGDSLKAIGKWSKHKKYNLVLTGTDLKKDCIDYARNNCKEFPEIDFRCSDFRDLFTSNKEIDVIHASLFFHHFHEDDIVGFIKLCGKSKTILMINDLERNPIAYYSIKFLTYLFSNSELVRHDAPLSVKRGFKKTEWQTLLLKAKVRNYVIKNCWAFRHLVIVYPNE